MKRQILHFDSSRLKGKISSALLPSLPRTIPRLRYLFVRGRRSMAEPESPKPEPGPALSISCGISRSCVTRWWRTRGDGVKAARAFGEPSLPRTLYMPAQCDLDGISSGNCAATRPVAPPPFSLCLDICRRRRGLLGLLGREREKHAIYALSIPPALSPVRESERACGFERAQRRPSECRFRAKWSSVCVSLEIACSLGGQSGRESAGNGETQSQFPVRWSIRGRRCR